MTRLRLVWSFAVVLAALVAAGEQTAHAGACISQTCTCDDDCNGLVCSADGHCCGPPTPGTPCHKTDAGTDAGSGGSAGTGGNDAGTPATSSGGCGCAIDGLGGWGGSGRSGATLAVAASLSALVAARRRSKHRR